MSIPLLLADDSPTIAKILGMALQSEDYEIRSVLTAEDALAELKKAPPALFLVDLSLPEKSGYEFARLIKNDNKLRGVKVVLLASAFEPVDEGEFASCGADGLVKKPFDPAELRAKLRDVNQAPARFPDGSKVTGSLSGFMVSSNDESTASSILKPSSEGTKTNIHDTKSEILAPPAPEGDADSILAGLMGSSPDAPPPFAPMPAAALEAAQNAPKNPEFTNATVAIDFTASAITPAASTEFDLSASFNTPPGGTAIIDLAAQPDAKTPVATPAPPPEAEPLSANAQALAAFFAAEIESKAPPAAAPAAPEPMPVKEDPSKRTTPPSADSFDASLGSIDWDGGPSDSSLNEWSASPTAKPMASSDAPPPFTAPRPTKPSADPGGASLLFDTGGSSFRFSDDYIHRITKSFTGDPQETVPASAAPHVFHQQSDDRPAAKPAAAPAATPAEGGGAWSQGDVARIEKIVREEVQMVVREVAEKIAWEVIPELAENLIRKELDKVLKEMGN